MKRRKKEDAPIVVLDGQLSVWDIKITEKNVPQARTLEVSENIEENSYILTEEQKKTIEKFKLQGNVSRVILYNAGSVGIETKDSDVFLTHYINKNGIEEFNFLKKSPVLPFDKIVYFSPDHEKFSFTKIQIDKLQRLLCKSKKDIKKVIYRKGDENILIEFENLIVDILPNGWELEFKSTFVSYTEDEIYLLPNQAKKDELKGSKIRVKTGDFVKALNGRNEIEGVISREYGLNNEILNIVFDNGKKHTAINRRAVLAILG